MNLTFNPSILKDSANGAIRVSVEDELFAARRIFFTDEVNKTTMDLLLRQIMYLHMQDPKQEITIYINSPGGEVISGLTVFDYLRMIETPVRTVCIGTAASMGAMLFLAGDRREMMPSSRLMIHDPSFEFSTTGMKPAELQERLDSLRQVQKTLCGIISDRTGKSVEEVMASTCKDTFFEADEAVRYGLATGIVSCQA